MRELIERLEKAEAGSRKLDAALWYALVEKPALGEKRDRDMIGRWPAYTTSLDAALALAERLGMDVLEIANEAVEELSRSGWFASATTLVPDLARHACIAILRASNPVEREAAQPTPQQEER
jgi:hypothetical protein